MGKYQGLMLLLVAMDGNNQILHFAYGVGVTESGHTWIFILEKIKECIGNIQKLAIILNRASSIDLTIRTTFPKAYHRICI